MKAKYQLLLVLAFALALLAACGPKENCAESYDDRRTNLARICTDKEKYDFGELVYITFTVTNVSNQPLTLDGGDEPAIDIWITQDRWSDSQEVTPELTNMTLEPGESRTIEFTWPTPHTDLDALMGYGSLNISVDGVVRPFPGADTAVWVRFHYGEGGGPW